MMYGQNGRIGLLVPSANTVVEPEFTTLVPPGVSVYATRMRTQNANVHDSRALLDHVDRAADELGTAQPDVIAFACTSGSFIDGSTGEQELRRRIEHVGQVGSVVTTAGAVIDALRRVDVRRVTVVTPYPDELNILEQRFLESEGIEVVTVAGMGIGDAYSIGGLAPQDVFEFAQDVWQNQKADGMFLSCTNLPTIEILARLENSFGVPVISSNSATAWACLRLLKIEAGIEDYGTLLDNCVV